ncbi:MAG: hypothetical protein AAGA77_01615 [Bacteroidota bacterium]
MRIKTQRKPIPFRWLLLLPLLGVVYFLFSPKKKKAPNEDKLRSTYFCDAEKFEEGEFITPNVNFRTQCKKTSSTSYSGSSSCKCGEGQRFALITDLENLKSFDTLEVSAATKNGERTKLKFVLSSNHKHYFSSDIPSKKEWGEYSTRFIIPKLEEKAV